jgi:hypothetical protein
MSTAIVRIHTSEGLVIASDTLVSNESVERAQYTAQKIFKIDHAPIRAAYAIAGQAKIIQPDGEVLLDVPTAIHEAIAGALGEPLHDFYSFSTMLSNLVKDKIRTAQRSLRPNPRVQREWPIQIFLDGYYQEGLPERFHIKIYRLGALPNWAQKQIFRNESFDNLGVGSSEVQKALDADDPRFIGFRPSKITDKLSLQEAICIANNRVSAQFGTFAPALAVDPLCRHIGGRVMIATVTLDHGFQWVLGFAPNA